MKGSDLLSRVRHLFDYLEGTSVLIGIGLFILITSITAFQIFVRFVDLGINTTWTSELARYLLVVMIFVGAPYAMRNDDNISIRPLFRLVPSVAQKILITFSNLMIIVFSVLVIHAVDQALDRTSGVTLSTINWLTVGDAQIVLAVMFALVILFAIEETILMWLSDEAPIQSKVPDDSESEDDAPISDGEGSD